MFKRPCFAWHRGNAVVKFEAYADQISESQSAHESLVPATNINEAQKWDEWDRHDSQSAITIDNNTTMEGSVLTKEDGSDFADFSARQAVAHQTLIRYTRSAMSEASCGDSNTRGYTTATSATGASSAFETSTYHTSASGATSAFGKSALGTDAFASTSSDTSHFDTDCESDSMLEKSKLSISTGASSTNKSEVPIVHRFVPSALSLNQRRILKNFVAILKKQGIEVLKQNRDSKWQVRYLTVSKESQQMNHVNLSEADGGVAECPNAVLWVKRFSPRSVYSASLIDKQGRGGVMLSHLVKVTATGRAESAVQLPKKYQDKYKDSVIVVLEYSLAGSVRSMAVRCKTTADAHFLCTGLRVCMDICTREKDAAAYENSK